MNKHRKEKAFRRIKRLLFTGLFLCLAGCSFPGQGKPASREQKDWEKEGFASKGRLVVGMGDISQFPYHEYEYHNLAGKYADKACCLVGDTRFVLQRESRSDGVRHRLLIQTKEEKQWVELSLREQGLFLAADAWQKEELYGLLTTGGKEGQEYAIFRFGASGEVLGRTDIADSYRKAGVTNGALKTGGCWYVDCAGYSYVIDGGGKLLHVFDETGKHVLTGDDGENGGVSYTGAFHSPDGRLIIQRTDKRERYTEFLHVKQGELHSLGKLDVTDGKCFVFDREDYIYYLSGSMLVKWDIQEGTREVLYSFYQGTRRMEEVTAMTLGEGGSLLLYVQEEGGPEVIRLWDREIAGREELELTMLVNVEADEGYVSRSAATYSRAHRESARIRCRRAEGDGEDFRTRVFAQMTQGEGPELLWVTREDMEILAKKGLLADLTELISGETLEQIFPGVIEAGTVDDCLVGIFPTGYVGMMVTSDEVWTGEHWSLSDILALAREPGREGIDISGFPLNLGLWNLSESGLLKAEGSSYSLDEELLRRLLEAAKNGSGKFLDEEERYVALSEGRYVTRDWGSVFDFPGFSEAVSTMLPENCHFVGYPGQTEWVGCWKRTNYLVVNKNAGNREVIADFLESFLSYDYLITAQMHCVREDVIRERIIEGNPEGFMLPTIYKVNQGGWKAMSKEDGSSYVEEYIEFLRSCGPEPAGMGKLSDIIRSEAKEYFDNRRSLDETVRIIKNRVELYLKEQ